MSTNLRPVCAAILLFSTLVTSGVDAQFKYWRCHNPKDKCTAFDEQQKADCPECLEWKEATFSISDVLSDARRNQNQAGITDDKVATNFFAASLAKELYDVDLGGDATPPKARQLYMKPAQYGFREATADEELGSLVLIGDVAGVLVKRDGKLQIAYLSDAKGGINYLDADTLEKAQKTRAKYLTPVQQMYAK